MVAFFPEWLASILGERKVLVHGPSGHVYSVDLKPENVHTLVLWSKNFSNILLDRFGLRSAVKAYAQLYFHFTVTGLGGGFIERGVPSPEEALRQLDSLVDIAGHPDRVSLRFDPVVFWKEKGEVRANLPFFSRIAEEARALGVKRIRFSFAQWYGKAIRRTERHRFFYLDPSPEEKKNNAFNLSEIAGRHGLSLYSCCQDFLAEVPGIMPSACIDGHLLRALHPAGEPAPTNKDESQRRECRCTESVDIGSYTQSCPHSCLYCYANPRTK